jgi:hypothetical protein
MLTYSLVAEKRYRSPFLMCLTMIFVLQFSGVNYIAAYSLEIFQVSLQSYSLLSHSHIFSFGELSSV